MQAMANTLMVASQTITDDELIMYILGGLGLDFESVVVNLTSCESFSLQEVQFMLQNQEMCLEQLNSSFILVLSIQLAQRKPYSSQYQHQSSSNHLDGPSYHNHGGHSYQENRPLCQVSAKPSHTSFKFYH